MATPLKDQDLCDSLISEAAPRDKEYTLSVGQGLSVVVRPRGTKMWLYRYTFGGKRKNISFGLFPSVRLDMAHQKRHAADMLLAQGHDPAAVRKTQGSESNAASRAEGGSKIHKPKVLSDTAITNAKLADKDYTLADRQGLSVLIRPNGTKMWLYRYTFGGKRKNMSFGIFPAVGLKMAREKRHAAETLLAEGKDPAVVREQQRKEAADKYPFRAVGDEVIKKLEKEGKAKATIKREKWNLGQLNKEIGARPVDEIEPPELLTALRKVEARGRYYTVSRLRSTASRVFQYGIGASYCSSDPTRDLKHALTAGHKRQPRPALTDPADVGQLMRRIEVYDARNGGLVRSALKLIALTLVRPGELRQAEWTEFDEKNHVWIVPKEKMKMREDHAVPLSRQALAILKELRPLTGQGKYLFSWEETPMSDATLNKALRIMGYDTGPGGDHCAHGFRSTGDTLLNEEGLFEGDVVEAQLSHETDEKKKKRRNDVTRRQFGKADKNKMRGIYNRAAYWSERIKLMQHWADWLDQLRDGPAILPFEKRLEKRPA